MSAPLHDGEGPSAVTGERIRECLDAVLWATQGADEHTSHVVIALPIMDDVARVLAAAARTPSPAEADLRAEVERLTRERDEVRARFGRLLVAFHDAINRPLGVVPASGAEFYDPDLGAMAELRRPLVGAPDLTPDRGGDYA